MVDRGYRHICVLAFFIWLGLAAVAAAEDRALVIGIGAYANLADDDQLAGPRNDVALMQDLLTNTLGFGASQIRTIEDGAARKADVVAAIRDWLVSGTEPGDRAFFYFSGHGVQVPDADGDEDDAADEALAMADIAPAEDRYENVLTDDEIAALFAGMEDRLVTFVVDACHSGTVTRAGNDGPRPAGARYLKKLVAAGEGARELGFRKRITSDAPVISEAASSFVSFSAAAPAQVAYEDLRLDPSQRVGVFTSAFVDGLSGGIADLNGNGRVSYSELLTHLRRQSNAYCDYLKTCIALTPVLEAPDLAYQFDVAPRFNTASEVPLERFDFTPQPGHFNTAPEPVPAEEQPVLDALATYSDYQPMPDETYAGSYHAATYDAVTETLGHLPDGTISLRTDPVRLVDGEDFVIELVSQSSGQLLLFDISDRGEAVQFFPNEIAEKNTGVTAGLPFRIPDAYYGFSFQATGAGGTILAVVVEQEADLSRVVTEADGLTGTMSAEAVIARITAALSGYVPQADGDYVTTRKIAWSYGILPYEVYRDE